MAEPLYRRIAEDLARKIRSGELRPGSQLPTELELERIYRASRNTVREAVRLLTSRRMVWAERGRGTFVAERIEPFVTTLSATHDVRQGTGEGNAYLREVEIRGRAPSTSEPIVEVQTAEGRLASELRIAAGSQLVSRHQQRYIDGLPYSLQTSFYPMTLVERGATDLLKAEIIRTGAVAYIERALHVKQAGYCDLITARAPDLTETAFFKLPEDGRVAVFENVRTAFDQHGAPIRVTITTYPTDRNEFVINSGEVRAEEAFPQPLAIGRG
jgi:GntR family transcriptional regulator